MPDFRCRCRFSSTCASMRPVLVCICVSILRPFFSALLCPVCHPISCPHDSFVTIGIRLLFCVTFILVYVSISHRFLSHFHSTINTLSRSVYIFLAIREILNLDEIQTEISIYYIPGKDTHLRAHTAAFKNILAIT